ncbi:MAG: DUF3732 domain-containing protein, partial [Bacteroidetes bacterium]|nr:DUF3732 domain-containing protein [Bacteroidota bacterium]
FTTGVNLITGKSSTGKSAMIEIFDYCFGNSDDTIPEGVITDSAQLFFITMVVGESNLILARVPKSNKGFLKPISTLPDKSEYNIDFFNENDFIPMKSFKEILGRHFGIAIEDTDTDLENRKYRRNDAKSPRPTVRNFTSYMLQHQNLVANKHALFYRFDQQQKREQTIDQFKVFAGFIKQDYYIKQQELNEKERELKELETRKNSLETLQKDKFGRIAELQKEYYAIAGVPLFEEAVEIILSNPSIYLEKISIHRVSSDTNTKEYIDQIDKHLIKRNSLIADKRSSEIQLRDIQASIKNAEQHSEDMANISTFPDASLHVSKCPFCERINEELSQEANKLEDAITWLNSELAKTPLLLDSFLADEKRLKTEIAELSRKITLEDREIQKIKHVTEKLRKNKSIEEQALKVKLKIENILEEKIELNFSDLDNQINKIKNDIDDLKKIIKDKYNPEEKLRAAERYINKAMKEIGENLDFESSYKPINLKFSLESFDLWHEKKDRQKVYLRSMGSGANWLYCHIALFTAIHKYFCSLKSDSLLPPILFLDQPSQVYFPTAIDFADSFDAKELKKIENKVNDVDEDLSSVTNLFNQLISFCNRTEKDTGIIPQIIVTDHADNLKLADVDFESIVNERRWRKRGFIDNTESTS